MRILSRAAGAVKSAVGLTVANKLQSNVAVNNAFGYNTYGQSNIEARNAYMTMSSIFGCVAAYALNDPQIKFQVQHLDGEPWPDHPVQWLIRNPNDDMSEKKVRLFNCIYKPLGGASHLYLYRNASDQVIGWRPFSTNEMTAVPKASQAIGRDSWTDYFWHTPLNGARAQVGVRDIITLAFPSVNPLVPQQPMSPIAAAFKDVEADLQITQLPIDLMKNGSFITWVFALGQGSEEMPDDVYSRVKADIMESSTAKNRFTPFVVRAGGSAEFQGVDFSKMEFSKLGARPELRICVALRVPIRYAGFAAGIDASTSDNYVGSWISFVKDAVIGQALLDADVMTNALTREEWRDHPTAILYGLDRSATNEFKIAVDTSEVQALKAETLSMHDNTRKNYQSGLVMKDEARSEIGKPPLGPENGGEEFGKGSSDSVPPTDRVSNITKTPQHRE